jgi:glycine hydroxymethyltransferase
MHVIAAKAVSFKEAMTEEFKLYQQQIIKNAQALADGLKQEGFNLVSNGTDNHLMLIDLQNKGLTGKEAEKILDKAQITCNKNTIPNDPQSPFVTSGIRIGTPAVTSRGMDEDAMKQIAKAISLALSNQTDEAKEIVHLLCEKYPLYKNLAN